MKAATEIQRTDPFAGYFASVALALVLSGWIAGFLVDQFSALTAIQLSPDWRVNIAAGLFLGIAFSNIVGVFAAKGPWARAGIRFVIGFSTGVATQLVIFTPFAGHGMSNFLFLLLAGGVVPLVLLFSHFQNHLDRRGITPGKSFIEFALVVLNWPLRIQFVVLMGVAFGLFWKFTSDINQVLIVIFCVLVSLTASVALREVEDEAEDENFEETEQRLWLELELEPEETVYVSDKAQALAKLRNLFVNLVPGALLFGGMTRLSVDFLMFVYPNIQANLNEPLAMLQTVGIVAVSGLAAVFFGMMAALGFGLGVLQLVGFVKKWSHWHLRENCVHLIRLMYFRPMGQLQN